MNKHDAYSDAFKEFELVADEYCSLVDHAAGVDRTQFLTQLYSVIPRLISAAIRLPKVELGSEDNEKDQRYAWQNRMNDEEWRRLYNSLKEKLADWDSYWQVFDPRTDNEAIYGSLADDIADVYRDVRDGICLKDANATPTPELIFNLRIGYLSHWAKHAMDALRIIHFLLEDALQS